MENVIFQLTRGQSTKLETDMAYEKVVTWRVKNLCFHMAHDYQTLQDDGLWHWATMHKVTWFFDHVIICCLLTKKVLYLQYGKSYGHQIWQGNGLKAIKLKVVKVILLKAIKFKSRQWFVQSNAYLRK